MSSLSSQRKQHKKSVIRWSISLFFYMQGLCFGTWASRIPDFKTNLKLSDAELGSLLLALPVGQLLTMPFSGRIVSRVGSRIMLIITAPLYGLALFAIGFASETWHLALFLFLFGVAGNLSNISLNTQGVSTEVHYGEPIMSSFHGSWSLGGFSSALLGLLMINLNVPPHTHFSIVMAICILNVFITYRFLISGTSKTKPKPFGFKMPEGELLQLGLIAFACMSVEGAMFDWSGVYFKEALHAPEGFVILGYTSFMIMMATGRFLGDKLVLKYGRKKMLRISGLTIFAGIYFAVLLPYIPTSAFGFMLVGAGVSSIVPMVYSLAGNNPKVPSSIGLTVVSGVGFLGFLSGPPLIGYISELFNLKYSFAAIGLSGLLIYIMVSRIKAIQ